MKNLLSLVALTTCLLSPAESKSPLPVPLAETNAVFAMELHGRLAGTPSNLFYSPFSISSALGMTASGAAGTTRDQMRRVLHFAGEDTAAEFQDLGRSLMKRASQSGLILRIANGLCLVEGEVAADFKELLRERFDAEIFSGDLARVNGWVNEKTNGKIPRILDQFPANTVCLLLNAIYFKGQWAEAFDKRMTRPAPFHLADGGTAEVSLMYRKGEYRWIEEEGFQALEIPYKGGAFSMVVFLPRAADGLPALEKGLDAGTLSRHLAGIMAQGPREIELYFPRFKLETEYDLVDPLRALGMVEAFDPEQADFSGMGWPKGSLWIGRVKHKAFVEVTEEGTEAAAATAVVMVTRAMMHNPVFRADRPFLFVLRDNESGAILFTGRFVKP